MNTNVNLFELDSSYTIATYARLPLAIERGSGCEVWDTEGRRYLDFLAGIAVCCLGHAHPRFVSAIHRQASTVAHVSNFLLTAPPARLAERLCRLSGMERVFFTSCGGTANETALKIAKKRGKSLGKAEILALEGGFHGRTAGALSVTYNPKYREPFGDLVPGVRFLPRGDVEALRGAFSESTAAIILEPIQGEAGVIPLSTDYLREVRALCDRHGALLILDEIQTGIGRTGTWFNFQQHGFLPDLLTLAKGLGGGMPIGACLARGEAAEILSLGEHGTTFGGSALMCGVALEVLQTLEDERLIENAVAVGDVLRQRLLGLGDPVVEVRGSGLMLGVRLSRSIAKETVLRALDHGLIVNAPDEFTLRLVPPLIVTQEQAGEAVERLRAALEERQPVRTSPHAEPAKLHDVLAMEDLSADQAADILALARSLKSRSKGAPEPVRPVVGRTVALVFEKASLRTRVTFEAAIRDLGGHPVYLTRNDIDMGKREAIKDVASNLSRWCSALVARLFWHRHLLELAHYSDAPVINALTELEHPCQALADMLTIQENFGSEKVKIAYVGDGNNVARSLSKLALQLGYEFAVVGPENFWLEPAPGLLQTASLEEGLAGAKAVYTDVWISMGDEHEQEHRLKVFEAYQVDQRVMSMASSDAIFLHCLPARRGFEVVDEVIDGPQSRVVDQAENRLYAQKALLSKVLGVEA
ncbi:MAG: acetylornithine transaminase [Fimbriimonadaceae bacterium]|nr:acetylornithine transaminase [Fimbriimonadaceae bacterium]